MTESFFQMLSEALGEQTARVAREAFAREASVSVRLHPSRIPAGQGPAEAAAHRFGEGIRPVPWNPLGFLLPSRPSFTLDPHFHGGAYYVQDSSAMFVGHAFRQAAAAAERPIRRVLDLCAAPGGKTTDLAASLRECWGDRFVLVANEVMNARVRVLSDNAGVWGDPAVVVTACDPAAMRALPHFFDAVVADVPCSGEGMFRKDAEAVRQWSPQQVALCQGRQRRILSDVWPSLAPGGLLVYATCTFNRNENDDNVAWICRELGAETLDLNIDMPGVVRTSRGYALVPGLVPGEGQYCAVLRKTGPDGLQPVRIVPQPKEALPKGIRLQDYFLDERVPRLAGALVTALPEAVAACMGTLRGLHPLTAGTAVGILKGKDFVPDADLAHCITARPAAFPREEVDRETALRFLHGDTLSLPQAPRGFLILCHDGLPLGFVKNVGNRCNNLYPASRRIRRDIRTEDDLEKIGE